MKLESRFQFCHNRKSVMSSLDKSALHQEVIVAAVAGERTFRRRLMEMGLVPGTRVKVVNVAPLGDPLELDLRHGRISIRRHEAAQVQVRP